MPAIIKPTASSAQATADTNGEAGEVATPDGDALTNGDTPAATNGTDAAAAPASPAAAAVAGAPSSSQSSKSGSKRGRKRGREDGPTELPVADPVKELNRGPVPPYAPNEYSRQIITRLAMRPSARPPGATMEVCTACAAMLCKENAS